jgi:hypothetical protein
LGLLFSFTLDYTIFFLFGEPVGSPRNIQSHSSADLELAEAFNTSMTYLAKRGRLQEYYWLIGGGKFKRACQLVHKYVDELVAKAIKSNLLHGNELKKHAAFFDGVLQNIEDPRVIRNQLLGVLIAGRDTTAGFLGWLLFVLPRNQDVLQKLRADVARVLGQGKTARAPTFEDLKEMKYLNCVLNESESGPTRHFGSCRINNCSPPIVSPGTLEWSYCNTHNNSSCRRGACRKSTNLSPERRKGGIQRLCTAPTQRFLWRRCKRVPAGKVAELGGEDFGWKFLPFNRGPRACLGRAYFHAIDTLLNL